LSSRTTSEKNGDRYVAVDEPGETSDQVHRHLGDPTGSTDGYATASR
jgi:hypothetical protein